ncbi:Global transcription regulator sge1 [Cladophialophora chaetospira]|uniref:Global transcription regulator sge1 n=1 Tax=Cladophialophora chaetospira TaxID=386627 RepID=A0AA39CI54_9EURO|nr:Global transcription regulator sge1 [Cladophialophora chaetospira]
MSSGGAALQPTFQGHVATTQDALILFEACLQGHLSHVPRRPHDRERSSLIRSGCVFIYEENASGIKRWTDGVTWSPSRILGNFLVYRELDKPFPPGEKKRAMKKQARRPSRPGEPYARSSDVGSYSDGQSNNFPTDRSASAEVERQLIGSLVDSYGFKQEGLVKKTMSVTVQGVTHHLVSYYHVNDVLTNQLRTPGQTDNLQYIRPRAELTQKQSFRAPIEEVDDVEGTQNAYAYRMNAAGYAQPPYYMPQNYPPMAQQPNPPHYPMGVPAMSAPYMQSPVTAPHLQGQRNDYSQYDQSAYNRSYESLNSSMPPSSKSIPPTPTTMAPMMPDRSQAQPPMYPPMNMQRPANNLSPVPVDGRNSVPYRPSPYPGHPNAGQMEQTRQGQPSPVHVKYEDRREPPPQQHPMYQSPRTPYYPDGAGQALSQPQYSQQPQMSQWASQSHGA